MCYPLKVNFSHESQSNPLFKRTEYRILRAKVLKILDENFKKAPLILPNAKDEDDLDLGYELPSHLKNTTIITRLKQHDSSFVSRSIDVTADSRSRSPKQTSGLKVQMVKLAKAEELNVKNLCRFLTGREIELV